MANRADVTPFATLLGPKNTSSHTFLILALSELVNCYNEPMKKLLIALLSLSLCACTAEPEPDPLLDTSWISEEGTEITIGEETDYTINDDGGQIEIDGIAYYPDDSDKAKEIREAKELEEKINQIKENLSGSWYGTMDGIGVSLSFILPDTTTWHSDEYVDLSQYVRYLPQDWYGTFTIEPDLSLTMNLSLQGYEDQEVDFDRDLSDTLKFTENSNEALANSDLYYCNGENMIFLSTVYSRNK